MEKLTVADIIGMVDSMSEVIIKNEVAFCELDSAAGDGDFGMSLAKGFKELKKQWSELVVEENIGAFLKACGMIITEHCGGASGPIWGSAFRAAGGPSATISTLSSGRLHTQPVSPSARACR